MKPYIHQEEIADQAYEIIKTHGLVYLAMEERTGKTLTSILVAEMSTASNILILTKKKALDGWKDTLKQYKVNKKYTVTNYHQAEKLKPEYNLIILDEAHSYLSAYPKPGIIWKFVLKLTKKKVPLIYLSATPYAQGMQMLYHQLKLSYWTPFNEVNFYRWFDVYGIPNMVRIPSGLVETYSQCKMKMVHDKVAHLFITKTRAELDFKHEPEDRLHYVTLNPKTRELYNKLIKANVVDITTIEGSTYQLVCDTPMKLRTALHMLESGTMKYEEEYCELENNEKIDAIKAQFPDDENLAIMYNYIAEGKKLKRHFSRALLLQGTSYAEGVDLSHVENLVILSQDFSTARHSQRRARQANKQRSTPITVHFFLVKGAISEQIYTTVSVNKRNYIDSLFDRATL